MLVEAIKLYNGKEGATAWWASRSVYVTAREIQDVQTRAAAQEKKLADAAISVNLFRTWVTQSVLHIAPSKPTNLFQNATYLALFDAAMSVAESVSTKAMYPENGSPRTLLYRFPLPLMSFQPQLNIFKVIQPLNNYYFPWIVGFYDFDSEVFASQLAQQIVR